MARTTTGAAGGRGLPWRRLAWGGAVLLMLLPLAAMQLTDEVRWSAGDFVAFGVLLAAIGGAFELALRSPAGGGRPYRTAAGLALGTAFLLLWANGAVGFIGDGRHPGNLLVAGVPAVAAAGAAIARLRPRGMAWALLATAIAQALVAAVARAAGWPLPWAPMALFVALWLASAWLFRKSAAGA